MWNKDTIQMSITHLFLSISFILLIYEINVLTILIFSIFLILFISLLKLNYDEIKQKTEQENFIKLHSTIIDYMNYFNNLDVYDINSRIVYVSEEAYKLLGHNILVYTVKIKKDENRKGLEVGTHLKINLISDMNKFFND